MIVYKGLIRDGKIGDLTHGTIRKCNCCGVESLDSRIDYNGNEYRDSYGESVLVKDHWKMVKEILPEESLKNKAIVDIGAGGGEFLNYARYHAKACIAVEPNLDHLQGLIKRNIECFDSIYDVSTKADIIVMFSVIEHLHDPLTFMKKVRSLMHKDSILIMSTPNLDDFVIRLADRVYKRFFYRTAHRFYFNKASLKSLLANAGFSNIKFRFFHRFGIFNAISWMMKGRPGHKKFKIDSFWKERMERKQISDYIYVEVRL